ncbi:hypothetical protein [Chitinivorax sp. B]|uniref:hypothetical protein n=1 Tax=Chitinivorax sp. B TaxID=2502235 RepID=UPI0010F4F691|nr:hypothetical protein [Chitinivorax sp. B]
MAKANPTIGRIPCACCTEEAALKEGANGLAYYTCQWCGYKGQAFSERSNNTLRKRGTVKAAIPEAVPPIPSPALTPMPPVPQSSITAPATTPPATKPPRQSGTLLS